MANPEAVKINVVDKVPEVVKIIALSKSCGVTNNKLSTPTV